MSIIGKKALKQVLSEMNHLCERVEKAEASLAEIAARINTHLKRFEADPEINLIRKHGGMGLKTYWNSGSRASGNRVLVTYVSYQGTSRLKKAEALAYLERLDAGHVGTHWQIARLRESTDPLPTPAALDSERSEPNSTGQTQK